MFVKYYATLNDTLSGTQWRVNNLHDLKWQLFCEAIVSL